ncbi:MAG: T9SS type A sorting domain-containing protein [Bacteroidales bacterium]
MKRIILILVITCFAINANAQNFTEIYRNDEFKVNQFTMDFPRISIINNKDDDNLWISYFDQSLENSKIISLDKDLNFISSTLIDYPVVLKGFQYKINDKLYRVSYKDQDTLKFRCFDINGNILTERDLWIKDTEDSLSLYTEQGFKYRCLSNNTFLLVANAKYPSNPDNNGTDAIRFILFDTLGNILNIKTIPLKAYVTKTGICEVGEHLILEKALSLPETNDFAYLGISYINKETLEIVDSIPRDPFIDTLPDGEWYSFHLNNIIAINDTTFAGLHIRGSGELRMQIYNKNTKEIIHTINPGPSTNVSTINNNDFCHNRFVFNNTDSIYTHYEYNGALTLLNFSEDGNINFQYKLTFPSDYIKGNSVSGMKITEDGDVIIATYGYTMPPDYKIAYWLIKFNPSGLIGLTNVETGERESIKVYPNPARDYVYVDIEATNFEKGEIELFDMQGKLVKKAKLNAKQRNRIDVSNLNSGAYTYNVSLNGKTISGKVIVGK